jgi:hypothetical protein
VTFYRVQNDPNYSVLIHEITRMLEEARDKANAKVTGYFSLQDIPPFQLSMQTPRIQGQNTQLFQGWDFRRQNWHKTLHLIVEATQVAYVQELFSMAKELRVLEKYFGTHARVVWYMTLPRRPSRETPRQTSRNTIPFSVFKTSLGWGI